MSFGGGWRPPWHQQSSSDTSWRPHDTHQAPGPMRGTNNNNGWNSWMADPYFARNSHAHNRLANLERNRMQMFHQPQRSIKKPLLENPEMTEYARQTLLNNSHVPGLRSGLQLKNMMQQKKISRELIKKDKVLVDALHVNVMVFSEKIELRWNHPQSKNQIKYVITCENPKTKPLEITTHTKFCELPVTAGEIYRVTLSCHDFETNAVMANWSNSIRAEFSYAELNRLLQKCYQFTRRGLSGEPQMHEFFVVYRCKPKVYWDEIHHYGNNVMQKYIKDDNGQPGNLINGKINGLFFSARLLPDMTLPMCSPFGNVRMVINAGVLLNPERHNFYFADFYCNKSIHYVTLVICVVESETDRYCKDRLIKLNPLSNPFVRLLPPRDQNDKWRYFVNYTLWVEIYYTEDIQLNMGQFSAIMATGAGTSRIGGLPNNKMCSLCNLYPAGKKATRKKSAPAEVDVDAADSTLAVLLQQQKDVEVDLEVTETICYLVDRVEEEEMSSEELTAKIDVELIAAVERMNKAVANAKTPTEITLSKIAKNLNDFMESFGKRRDALIQDVKKLKNE